MHIHDSSLAGRMPAPDAQPLLRALAKATAHTLRALHDGLSLAIEYRNARARLRRDRAALLSMPDHMLRDIGMSRQEIVLPFAREPRSERKAS